MIQIFRADFGPQSADSSSDEPPESESGERETERRLTAGQKVQYGSMERWHRWGPICSSVCVCVSAWLHTWLSVCVCVLYICVFWCVQQLNWSSFVHQANSITAGWMFGPLALCSKTHDPLKCCLLTSDQPVVALLLQADICTCSAGKRTFSPCNWLHVTDYLLRHFLKLKMQPFESEMSRYVCLS